MVSKSTLGFKMSVSGEQAAAPLWAVATLLKLLNKCVPIKMSYDYNQYL